MIAHLLAFYISMGICSWIYIGFKDSFRSEGVPLAAEALDTVIYLVLWYPILARIAVQQTGSADSQNLEKQLEKMSVEN